MNGPITTNARDGILRIAELKDDEDLGERILLPALRGCGFKAVGAGTAAEWHQSIRLKVKETAARGRSRRVDRA